MPAYFDLDPLVEYGEKDPRTKGTSRQNVDKNRRPPADVWADGSGSRRPRDLPQTARIGCYR